MRARTGERTIFTVLMVNGERLIVSGCAMKRGRGNGKYGRWARAIRGELAGVCERLDVAEDAAIAAERARLEAAIAAIDTLIGHGFDEESWRDLRPRAAEGLSVLRELVANTVIEFEDGPTLALPGEGMVKGRIL